MLSGYHTGGLLLHPTNVAIEELATLGFQAVAIRPHAATFHFDAPHFRETCLRIADTLKRHELKCVLDLDGYFLTSPYDRFENRLIADEASSTQVIEQMKRWFDVAGELDATIVTFSSGQVMADESQSGSSAFRNEKRISEDLEWQLDQMANHLRHLLRHSDQFDFRLAVRPCHGNFIGSIVRYEQIQKWLGDSNLSLAADVGEMLMEIEIPIADRLERHLETLACVYLCDRKSGDAAEHRDVEPGNGDVAVDRIIRSLDRMGFAGPAIVRVDGHADLGLGPARRTIDLFQQTRSKSAAKSQRNRS